MESSTKFNFAEDVVDRWAKHDPAQKAMISISRRGVRGDLSFEHFSRVSHQVAHMLASLGIKKGDVCMMVLPRTPEWWEIFTGIIRVGAVPAPCTTLLVTKDLEYRASTARAVVFIGDLTSAAKFDACRASTSTIRHRIIVDPDSTDTPPRQDWLDYHHSIGPYCGQRFPSVCTKSTDDGLLYFTSGTTGNPKMVIHSQISYALGHMHTTGMYWLRLDRHSVYWNLSEQGWAKAGWSVCAAWSNGAALFVNDSSGAFDPIDVLKCLNLYEITVLCAPPTAYRPMVSESSLAYIRENPFRALRHCTGAGEPLNPEVIRLWHKSTGLSIRDGYGQTETVMICGSGRGVQVKPGSMGKPSPGIHVAILDDHGNEIVNEEGDIGVLLSVGSQRFDQFLFKGYRAPHDNTLSRPTRSSPPPPHPTTTTTGGDTYVKTWYLTGDRARVDQDGYFWFIGRNDDVINSAGYRIGPFEVESALKTHPAVLESAVVASPDPSRSEIVKAFVVLASGYPASAELAQQLQSHVKMEAAPYKYPREIEFVSDLPKTVSGKIRRVELRQRERQRKAATSAAAVKDSKL